MNEKLKKGPRYQDIIRQGEEENGFYVLTPEIINGLGKEGHLVVADAIGRIIRKRYGDGYGDESIYNPAVLVGQFFLGDFHKLPEGNKLLVWLVGTEQKPGLVTAVSVRPPDEAKLVKSAKSPEAEFASLQAGKVMRRRIPFIIDNLPYIRYFHTDCRTARPESVAIDVKSPSLTVTGFEPKHYFTLSDRAIVQEGSVIMLGIVNPEMLLNTPIYFIHDNKTEDFIRPIIDHMNTKLGRSVLQPIESELGKEIYQRGKKERNKSYNLRKGEYASVIVSDTDASEDEIRETVARYQEELFGEGIRYLTFEINPADISSLKWQLALEEMEYLPTRLWPAVGNINHPTLRYGKLGPSVTDVFKIRLPKLDPMIPSYNETSATFNSIENIGNALFIGRNQIDEVF